MGRVTESARTIGMVQRNEFTGGQWPPIPRSFKSTFDPWGLPLVNTLILLFSGTTVTWAHHALLHNDRKGLIWGLALTVILGVMFTALQAYEYGHAAFSFSGHIYGSTFFMATGFHGFHVIVGTIFLFVCLFRAIGGALHAEAAFWLRSRRLVLALRRRGLAVPVPRDLRLGRPAFRLDHTAQLCSTRLDRVLWLSQRPLIGFKDTLDGSLSRPFSFRPDRQRRQEPRECFCGHDMNRREEYSMREPTVSPFHCRPALPLPTCGNGPAVQRRVQSGFGSDNATNCGLSYNFIDTGDGPAVFVIMGLGF